MIPLKTRMLYLGIFENNQYLEAYCNLIERNKNTPKIPFQTQQHHIFPRFLYKDANVELDNTKFNLVNLEYKDHILAHYYLCLCSVRFIYKFECAFFYMTQIHSKNFDMSNLDKYVEIYNHYLKFKSNQRKGKHFCLKNEFQKGSVNWKAIENSHKPEIIEKKRQKMIGKKPWNFGKKMSKEYCEKCKLRALKMKENGTMPTNHKKAVFQYDLDGNLIQEYSSIMDAYNETGIDFRLISLVCKGKRNSTGGYKWRFK